jgi:hypothetical protein
LDKLFVFRLRRFLNMCDLLNNFDNWVRGELVARSRAKLRNPYAGGEL